MDLNISFESWKYFRSKGDIDKGRMVSIATWLLSSALALLAYLVKTHFVCEGSICIEKPLTALIFSCAGIAVCYYTYFVVNHLGDQTYKNWLRSEFIFDKFKSSGSSNLTVLKESLDEFENSGRGNDLADLKKELDKFESSISCDLNVLREKKNEIEKSDSCKDLAALKETLDRFEGLSSSDLTILTTAMNKGSLVKTFPRAINGDILKQYKPSSGEWPKIFSIYVNLTIILGCIFIFFEFLCLGKLVLSYFKARSPLIYSAAIPYLIGLGAGLVAFFILMFLRWLKIYWEKRCVFKHLKENNGGLTAKEISEGLSEKYKVFCKIKPKQVHYICRISDKISLSSDLRKYRCS